MLILDQDELVRASQVALLADLEGFGRPKLSSSVRRAFLEVPRHLFVSRYREYGHAEWSFVGDKSLWRHLPTIYREGGLAIWGSNDEDVAATISHPSVVLLMLSLLHLKPGMQVLEIGTGSGWNAGLLASIVGPQGTVDSVEIVPQLAADARQNIQRARLTNVNIVDGDGSLALDHTRTYDRVIFTAGCHDLPAFLYDRVSDRGILQLVLKCPGGGDILLVLRKSDDAFISETAQFTQFVSLRGKGYLPEFEAGSLESFAPWAELRHLPVGRRAFYSSRTEPHNYIGKTLALRSYLAVVEPRMQFFTDCFGLWDTRRKSLALVRDGTLSSFGGMRATSALDAHLQQWAIAGFPSMETMTVRACRATTTTTNFPEGWTMRRPDTNFFWYFDTPTR